MLSAAYSRSLFLNLFSTSKSLSFDPLFSPQTTSSISPCYSLLQRQNLHPFRSQTTYRQRLRRHCKTWWVNPTFSPLPTPSRCYADFARVGGRQQVSLADECIDYPTIIHEFMHVVGFIHEHQRDDRDGYVKINWNNIIPGRLFLQLLPLYPIFRRRYGFCSYIWTFRGQCRFRQAV